MAPVAVVVDVLAPRRSRLRRGKLLGRHPAENGGGFRRNKISTDQNWKPTKESGEAIYNKWKWFFLIISPSQMEMLNVRKRKQKQHPHFSGTTYLRY